MPDHRKDDPTPEHSLSSPFPPWAWILFAGLYSMAIPWWLPERDNPVLVLGVPLWVLVSLLGGLVVAVTANILMRRYWHD